MNNSPLLPTFTIATPDGRTQASFVPERGGVVSSFIVEGGRELLFQHNFFWDKDHGSSIPLVVIIYGILFFLAIEAIL